MSVNAKAIGIVWLLPLLGMSARIPSLQALPADRGWIVGITGSSPERAVGEVQIEVRRFYAPIATWTWWRGAPLPRMEPIRGRSDKQGRFRISVDAGYEYEVLFSKPGYKNSKSIVYANRPFLGPMEKLLEKGASEAHEKKPDSATRPSRTARGTLRDEVTGMPVVDAGIREFWGTKLLTRSHQNGEFEVHCTPKQAEDDLLVWAKGYRLTSIPSTAFGNKDGIAVQLQAARPLHGKLVDAQGKPQAGRWVVMSTDVPVGEATYGEVALWTQTDMTGSFAFSVLAPGWRYWVRTLLPSGSPFEIAEGLMPGGPKDLGSSVAAAGFSVEGRVMGPNAKPLPGGRVHVLRLFDGKPTQYQIVRTTPSFPIDATGRFRIPGLAPYPHELCFFLEGLEHAVRVVKPPEKGSTVQLNLTMGLGRQLKGIVVDADGKPVGGALLRGMVWSEQEFFPLVPQGDMNHRGRFIAGNIRVLTRPDGTFLLERLRSRLPLRIVCSKNGYKTVKLRLPATPGKSPLRIELR